MVYIENKEWYKSKTVLAALGTLIVACVTAAFGETSTVTAVVIAVASALGIYGRVNAKTNLK